MFRRNSIPRGSSVRITRTARHVSHRRSPSQPEPRGPRILHRTGLPGQVPQRVVDRVALGCEVIAVHNEVAGRVIDIDIGVRHTQQCTNRVRQTLVTSTTITTSLRARCTAELRLGVGREPVVTAQLSVAPPRRLRCESPTRPSLKHASRHCHHRISGLAGIHI